MSEDIAGWDPILADYLPVMESSEAKPLNTDTAGCGTEFSAHVFGTVWKLKRVGHRGSDARPDSAHLCIHDGGDGRILATVGLTLMVFEEVLCASSVLEYVAGVLNILWMLGIIIATST